MNEEKNIWHDPEALMLLKQLFDLGYNHSHIDCAACLWDWADEEKMLADIERAKRN